MSQKEYFRIGEVAHLVGVRPHVLRYWESEFKRDIRPQRTRANQRMYHRRDVETFLEIKRLRYEEKLAVPGARKRLRNGGREPATPRPVELSVLQEIMRGGLEELIRIVDEDERDE